MSQDYRASGPVCVMVITYTAPIEAVDALRDQHLAWLQRGFAEGLFLIAGRQVPRTGGVIVCRGERAEVEALSASDPFVTGRVASVAVIEMAASFAQPEIAGLLE